MRVHVFAWLVPNNHGKAGYPVLHMPVLSCPDADEARKLMLKNRPKSVAADVELEYRGIKKVSI